MPIGHEDAKTRSLLKPESGRARVNVDVRAFVPARRLPVLVVSWLILVANSMSAQTQGPRTIEKGEQSNIEDARQVVVRTEAEWERLWHQHAPDRPRPAVDFSKETVLGVFMGSRPNAGFNT